MNHKKVPAIEKCFTMLDFLARSKEALRISDIAKALQYNQSTVFNMVYTMVDLGILEKRNKNQFHFGPQFYVLSRYAIRSSDLINGVRPYLEEVSSQTRLMTILGIRSGLRIVILDKINSDFEIQIISEVGMRLPLLAGAGGKAILSQSADQELDEILAKQKLERYTPYSCTNKAKYRAMILETREKGIATDMEEYIEGVRALAVPLKLDGRGVEAAIWVVGLKDHIKDDRIEPWSELLKRTAHQIKTRLALS